MAGLAKSSGDKFERAGRFLTEARAGRRAKIAADYAGLFASLKKADAVGKTMTISLKPIGKEWTVGKFSVAKPADAVPLTEGEQLKIDYLTLKPGLADIFRYHDAKPGKRADYTFMLEGLDIALQPAAGTGLPMTKLASIGDLNLQAAKMGRRVKVRLASPVRKAKAGELITVDVKTAAEPPKECTCLLTDGKTTRSFPSTTRGECMTAATMYGLDWKWVCD